MSFKVWAAIMMLVALLVCVAVVGMAWKQSTPPTVRANATAMRQALDAAHAAASAADAAQAATRATEVASEPGPPP